MRRTARPSLLVRSLASAGTTLCLALGSVALAHAEDEPAGAPAARTAREEFEAGARLFAARRYEAAAERFEQGWELSHRPAFLLNAAQSYRLLGRDELAAERYRRFLQLEPDSVDAEDIRRWLDGVDGRATAAPKAPAPAAAETAVLEEPAPAPGPARKRGKKGATPARATEDEPFASVAPIDPAPAPIAEAPAPAAAPAPSPAFTPPPADAERSMSNLRVASYVLLGTGVAGLGAGVAFNLRANGKADVARDLCAADAASPECRSARDEYDISKTMGWFGYGVGGAAAATGAVLLVVDLVRGRPDQDGMRVAAAPVAGGGAVTLSGRF